MILREEMFEQTEGQGILELRGGELEVALFVNGEPFVYDAADCGGSVCRFTALLPEPPQLPTIQSVELNAQNGFLSKKHLKKQVAPLLGLLPNGSYRLALVETAGCGLVDWNSYGIEKHGQAVGYHPLGDNYEWVKWLIPTQLDNVLQDERINFYLSEIERGVHPALIVIGSKDHQAWFMLDGHHKMMASWCCGVMPRALLIEFQFLPPISPESARTILSEVNFHAESYLKWKEHQAWFSNSIQIVSKHR